jgi:hypothetical protein
MTEVDFVVTTMKLLRQYDFEFNSFNFVILCYKNGFQPEDVLAILAWNNTASI